MLNKLNVTFSKLKHFFMKTVINYLQNYKTIHSIKPYKIVKLPTGLIVEHYRNGKLIAKRMITNGYEHECN